MGTNTYRDRLTAFADAVSGVNDPSMGDERQRDVILRAYTFAMQIGVYLSLVLAVWLSVVGAGKWSLLPVLFAGLSSWAAIWYCARDGVDLFALTARVRRRRRWTVSAVSLMLVIPWALAVAFHVLTGSPIWETGIDLGDGALSGPSVAGAVVGGAVGVLVVLVLTVLGRRRAEPQDDDE